MNRRMFRGRGPPTDRNLPKHNARRRKQPRASHSEPGDAAERPDEGNPNVPMDSSSCASDELQIEILQELEVDLHPPLDQVNLLSESANAEERPWSKEIQHLEKRINNVQESIQLGTEGIANPSTYRQNVLNAVDNCINEWRAIATHYNSDLDSEIIEQTSLLVFGLLQLALQSGPLAGGKPAYFKRCGSAVAREVLHFLQEAVPNPEASLALGFSQKQVDAIETWRVSTQKAVNNDKPPSKSALKMQQGKSKKKMNKKTA